MAYSSYIRDFGQQVKIKQQYITTFINTWDERNWLCTIMLVESRPKFSVEVWRSITVTYSYCLSWRCFSKKVIDAQKSLGKSSTSGIKNCKMRDQNMTMWRFANILHLLMKSPNFNQTSLILYTRVGRDMDTTRLVYYQIQYLPLSVFQ